MHSLVLFLNILMACPMEVSGDHSSIKTEKTDPEDLVEMVLNNDLEGIEIGLKNGADVNTKDREGRSLLLLATINDQYEMARLLVRYRADVNQQDQRLESPFLTAGARGKTEFVKLYLKNGARFDVFNRYYGSALIPACERGHVETVRVLVNVKDYPIDHINNLGWTALLEAVILGNGGKNHQTIVKLLKDAGADLTIPDKNGVTALEHAKTKGQKEMVRILED